MFLSVGGLRDAVVGGASKTAHVEVLLQQFVAIFADREPAVRDSGDARERHVQKSQLTNEPDVPPIRLSTAAAAVYLFRADVFSLILRCPLHGG